MDAAIEAGADDVHSDSEEHLILTAANTLRNAGLKPVSEKLAAIPQTPCFVSDLTIARQVLQLHDLLDDYPDTLTSSPILKWPMKSSINSRPKPLQAPRAPILLPIPDEQ